MNSYNSWIWWYINLTLPEILQSGVIYIVQKFCQKSRWFTFSMTSLQTKNSARGVHHAKIFWFFFANITTKCCVNCDAAQQILWWDAHSKLLFQISPTIFKQQVLSNIVVSHQVAPYSKFPLIRNSKCSFCQEVSFYKKQNLYLNFIISYGGQVKAERNKNMKKYFIAVSNLAGFVTFHFALYLILAYSVIVRTCETILTHDLRVRNTGPRFHLVSCYRPISQHKKLVYNGELLLFIKSMPGDFATKVKQISSQSGLIWMSNFAGPSYLTIGSSVYIILIWDPYIFNLYNLWQTRYIYIRRKPRQYGLHFKEQITKTYFLLLQPSIRPIPAQVILLWKGPPKLCIECHFVLLWAFPPKSPGDEWGSNFVRPYCYKVCFTMSLNFTAFGLF